MAPARHEEKGKGGMVSEKESKHKKQTKENRAVVKANNSDDIDLNKPVSSAFYLSLNGPKR